MDFARHLFDLSKSKAADAAVQLGPTLNPSIPSLSVEFIWKYRKYEVPVNFPNEVVVGKSRVYN